MVFDISSHIKKEVPLSRYTTFRIGGKAKYFLRARNEKEIIEGVKWARQNGLAFFILGGGSNLLVSDKGYKGLVIKVENQKIQIQSQNPKAKKTRVVTVASGVLLADVVEFCRQKSLAGLEWAAGIPGTVGGAVRGNAAAFGKKMADVVDSVKVFDAKTSRVKFFSNRECKFSPKNSIFKKNKNLIILETKLKLFQGKKSDIEREISKILEFRKNHHPHQPSAGCVFVNPSFCKKYFFLINQFPEMKIFQEKGYLPAAFLIEKAGLKNKKIGGAKISQKHANFIVNFNRARAGDVLKLITFVKKRVKKIFDVTLKEEIEILK